LRIGGHVCGDPELEPLRLDPRTHVKSHAAQTKFRRPMKTTKNSGRIS
jgi:hypothetical protein